MRMLLGFKLRMLFGLCIYAYAIRFSNANAFYGLCCYAYATDVKHANAIRIVFDVSAIRA